MKVDIYPVPGKSFSLQDSPIPASPFDAGEQGATMPHNFVFNLWLQYYPCN
jgi:hypothetical protein